MNYFPGKSNPSNPMNPMNPMNPINYLTIDVEDYFQVHALSKVIRPEDWDSYECRVERNTHYILDLLDAYRLIQNSTSKIQNSPAATFFILGWIAERYPKLVKEIHHRGHEIASHGYAHQVIYNQTPQEFRQDIRRAKDILEDLIGNEVIGYRAPTYSITPKTLWALNILAEEGYKYDSSVFPIRHDYYGMPSAPLFPFIWDLSQGEYPKIIQCSQFKTQNSKSKTLFEFPMSTVTILNHRFPCSGGGYFRILPYFFTRLFLNKINKEGRPFIFYLHPWELDPDIPRTRDISFLCKFRTYVNLSKTKARFKRLLAEFDFQAIRIFRDHNAYY